MREFLEILFEPSDRIEVRFIPGTSKPKKRRPEFYYRDELAAKFHYLKVANDAGYNVYFGANPRSREGGTAQDVSMFRCLFVDIDDIEPDAALQKIRSVGLPDPSAFINSGHGAHAYWRLEESRTDIENFARCQVELLTAVGGDPKVQDLPRIMRLPGLLNLKNGHPVPCELLHQSGCRYLLPEVLNPIATHPPPTPHTPLTLHCYRENPESCCYREYRDNSEIICCLCPLCNSRYPRKRPKGRSPGEGAKVRLS